MQQIVQIRQLHITRSRSFSLLVPGLQVEAGHTLCIVGPNGSGKTTLIECLAGILRPSSGVITIEGRHLPSSLRAVKRLTGFVPDDENWLIQELCAKEYFALLTGIYRQAGCKNDISARVRSLAKALQFTAFEQQLRHLSHGNKKKVQLIAALMHQPKLLVVDEVRNGLDPLAIVAIESLLRDEVARGMGLVAATHDLWWAERIADEVLMLVEGSISTYGKTTALVARHGSLEKLFLRTVHTLGDKSYAV